jgi:hypothetical protein
LLRISDFYRYSAVFGAAFELEDVEDAKLPDEAEYAQMEENPASLKMEKLAHVSPQFLYSQFLTSICIW